MPVKKIERPVTQVVPPVRENEVKPIPTQSERTMVEPPQPTVGTPVAQKISKSRSKKPPVPPAPPATPAASPEPPEPPKPPKPPKPLATVTENGVTRPCTVAEAVTGISMGIGSGTQIAGTTLENAQIITQIMNENKCSIAEALEIMKAKLPEIQQKSEEQEKAEAQERDNRLRLRHMVAYLRRKNVRVNPKWTVSELLDIIAVDGKSYDDWIAARSSVTNGL